MSLTHYAANEILSGNTLPSTLYLQVHTGSPGVSALNEVSVAIPSRTVFTVATPVLNVATNVALIDLTTDGTGTDTLVACSAWDAATSGNPIYTGSLLAVTVTAGEELSIAVGDLVLRGI